MATLQELLEKLISIILWYFFLLKSDRKLISVFVGLKFGEIVDSASTEKLATLQEHVRKLILIIAWHWNFDKCWLLLKV